MTENNQSTGGQSRMRTLVLPEISDGDGSFTDWICHYESVTTVNGLGDDDKILWLRVKLTGKAHVAYSRLSHKIQQSYATTKEALNQRFEPPSN